MKAISYRGVISTSVAAIAGFTILQSHFFSGDGHTSHSDNIYMAGAGTGGMGRTNLANVAKI